MFNCSVSQYYLQVLSLVTELKGQVSYFICAYQERKKVTQTVSETVAFC